MSRQVQKSFDRASSTYHGEALIQKETARECAARIPRGKYPRVLEIGAGGGLLTRECLSRIQSDLYVAMDLSRPMLQVLPLEKTFMLQGDGEYPPFKSRVFDLLVSSSAMQWYSRGPQALLEDLEVLAPGGRFSWALFVSGTFRQMAHISSASGFGSVLPMPRDRECVDILSGQKIELKAQAREYTRYFASVPEFLFSHRRTGARYTGEKPGFGKKRYDRFCRMYMEIYGQRGLIPVDYRVLYLWGKKI